MQLNKILAPSKFLRDIKHEIGYIDDVPFYQCEYDFLLKRDADEYKQIKKWVDTKLMPYMTRKSINMHHSSYGLKHTAENEIGFYVSNGDIKLILLENGVSFWKEPGNPNVAYPISQKFYRSKERKERRRNS